ncbi:M23 family metallopeptidase [Sulfuriroseicoccus oceanibius]|uniref:M23 family metallopeptidase n=1 Tax=Sulfuriroseicoccus oceanibius TaxID=2707525 RepID=A0A6B3LCA5_9BACT|nr:M23 family metallopeptidase [Sulfuriroseicoccus oceanibius]QQL44902.1 M23 family metallopeptidase [Sulfuriroseicoccus oceanibius]
MRKGSRARALWVGSAATGLVVVAVLIAVAVKLKQLESESGPVVALGATYEDLQAVDVSARDELLPVDPWWLVGLPEAGWFISPMGARSGAMTYNAQGFDAPNATRGGRHAGDDLNGIGQENSDLGDPVYAAANGGVLFAAEVGGGWGGVVVLQHRMADGTWVQTVYAHLESIFVLEGSTVARGENIGSVGNADGAYLAHLHFEVRRGVRPYLGAGYLPMESGSSHGRVDPTVFLKEHGPPFADALFYESPLGFRSGVELRVSSPDAEEGE